MLEQLIRISAELKDLHWDQQQRIVQDERAIAEHQQRILQDERAIAEHDRRMAEIESWSAGVRAALDDLIQSAADARDRDEQHRRDQILTDQKLAALVESVNSHDHELDDVRLSIQALNLQAARDRQDFDYKINALIENGARVDARLDNIARLMEDWIRHNRGNGSGPAPSEA